MRGIQPLARSTARMQEMVGAALRKGERVRSAIPVWIGGTYFAFFGAIVAAVALASGVATSLRSSGLVIVALGAAVGAVAGRWLAVRRMRAHPVHARALQVFLGVTDRRLLVYEPSTWGKPGRLLAEVPLASVGEVEFVRGGLIRPSRITFTAAGALHRYEFSGLWEVDDLLRLLA